MNWPPPATYAASTSKDADNAEDDEAAKNLATPHLNASADHLVIDAIHVALYFAAGRDTGTKRLCSPPISVQHFKDVPNAKARKVKVLEVSSGASPSQTVRDLWV